MKKLYQKPKYKRWHNHRLKKLGRKNRTTPRRRHSRTSHIPSNRLVESITVPKDIRLLKKTSGTLEFLRDLRKDSNVSYIHSRKFLTVDFSDVLNVDYSTISVLIAINEDLKRKRVKLRGFLPKDPKALQIFEDSGFLNEMSGPEGEKFSVSNKSDIVFFEKGSGKLTENDLRKLSEVSAKIYSHLLKADGKCQTIGTIIREICANTIEWSGHESKQWVLGVKYEKNEVIMTAVDIGVGIIKNLRRKKKDQAIDFFRDNSDVLMRTFDKQYGSRSGKVNRNKGLPVIKKSFSSGKILALKVMTNDVILHFDEPHRSQTFERGRAHFKGTFYRWKVNQNCLKG